MISFTKNIFMNKLINISLLLLSLFLTACNSNSQFQVKSSATTAGTTNVTQSNLVDTSSCSSQASYQGWVYNESLDGNSYSSTAFQQRVQDFVSTSLAPSDLGTVSGVKSNSGTYIALTAHFAFDSNNQIITSASSFEMDIYDSFVGTTLNGSTVGAYPIAFSQASSGSVDKAQKTLSVVFKDSLGTITFTGSFVGNQLVGRVDFANTKYYDNSQTPKSGVLGAFTISNCVFAQ